MRTGLNKIACLGSIGPFCRHTDVMKADVVVIGAGALGLSTALHCAIAGRSVVVVERDTAGSHASGRAAGLFKSVQTDELRTGLARRSIAKDRKSTRLNSSHITISYADFCLKKKKKKKNQKTTIQKQKNKKTK